MSQSQFHPTKDGKAGKALQNPLHSIQDKYENISMIISSSAIFALKINSPFLLWAGWFILLSLYINRKGMYRGIPQIGIALILMTLGIIYFYFRLGTSSQ